MLQLQMMLQADEELQNCKGCVPVRKKTLKKFGKFGEFEVFCQILDNEDFFIPKKV